MLWRRENRNGVVRNQWRGSFKVLKTTREPKRGLGANYFAYLHPDAREQLGTDDQFIVVRRFDTGEAPREELLDAHEERVPVLKARCQLKPSTLEKEPTRAGQVRLDQTLRNALGMTVKPRRDDSVDLVALRRSKRAVFREWLGDWVLRRRYLFMRVRKADPSDMEKRLLRIPADSFHLLGVSPGEKLVISSPKKEGESYEEKRCSLQAFPVTAEMVERQGEDDGGLYDRYPNPEKLFGVTPDLRSIHLDQKARETLGVRTLEVVRVRRSDLDAFLQRTRAFSLATAASALAIINIFPIHKTVINGILVLIGALLLAMIVLIFNLRASAYGKPS